MDRNRAYGGYSAGSGYNRNPNYDPNPNVHQPMATGYNSGLNYRQAMEQRNNFGDNYKSDNYPTQNVPHASQYGGLNSVIINPSTLQQAPAAPVVTTHYGSRPQNVTCPYCHAYVQTMVDSEATSKTHLNALLICCLCGCLPGLCLIPYCCNSCQTQQHHCPNCQAFLGTNFN